MQKLIWFLSILTFLSILNTQPAHAQRVRWGITFRIPIPTHHSDDETSSPAQPDQPITRSQREQQDTNMLLWIVGLPIGFLVILIFVGIAGNQEVRAKEIVKQEREDEISRKYAEAMKKGGVLAAELAEISLRTGLPMAKSCELEKLYIAVDNDASALMVAGYDGDTIFRVFLPGSAIISADVASGLSSEMPIEVKVSIRSVERPSIVLPMPDLPTAEFWHGVIKVIVASDVSLAEKAYLFGPSRYAVHGPQVIPIVELPKIPDTPTAKVYLAKQLHPSIENIELLPLPSLINDNLDHAA